MKIKSNLWRMLPATVFAAGVGSTPAIAQETKESTVVALEEVIVTAQRRQESAQDVAISITVFNQEQIANANMTNASDLATYTPSLSTNNRFGPENASFSVRGFTKALRTTASVGVYFAEVVAPRGQSIQTSGDGAGPGTMFDLQNVQVLKGPQGTLFGRNTTGGAILFEPRRPTEEFEGYVELTAGDYGLRQQQAVLNYPVTDWLRTRLSLDNKERDGHLNNITGIGADKLGNADYIAGRLSVVADITSELENYTIINYADSETNGSSSRLFDCSTASPTESPLVALTGPGCRNQLEMQRATGQDGFYDMVSTVATPITAIEDLRAINKLTWFATEAITIKNILAFSTLETRNGSDVFGTQFTETQATVLPFDPTGTADPNREFSPGVTLAAPDAPVTDQDTKVAELQIQGLSFDSRLQWQGGIYYENSTPNGFSGNNAAILVSCELATLESPNPDDFNCNDPALGQLGGASQPRLKTEYTNRAVYTQATFDVLPWLSVTGGARYTWDRTDGEINFTLYTYAGTQQQEPVVTRESESQESEAPTGMLELQFRPFEDVMVYTKYTRGYRQGSVNMAADAGIQVFDEEKVDTYEVGAKTSWQWVVPGRFNVSFFDNDFTDMQLQTGYISQTKGPTTALFNAGSAEIRGVEAEAFFKLLEGLSLSLSYSRLLTELLEQEDNCAKVEQAAGFVSGATCSPSADEGDTLPFAQEKAYTANLNYTLPLPVEWGIVDMGITYSFTGTQRASASSTTPYDEVPQFEIYNVNLSWKDIFGAPVDLSLFGTNVKDTEYIVYYSGTYNSLGFSSRLSGMPRMYGARLRYNFGR